MATRNRKPKQTAEPGAAPVDTSHDADAALAAGQAGGTHKVTKHPAPETLPPSKTKGDPDRKKEMPVNKSKEMPYAEAMKKHAAAVELARLEEYQNPTDAQLARMAELRKTALTRSVLTEKGWVVAPNKKIRGAGAG